MTSFYAVAMAASADPASASLHRLLGGGIIIGLFVLFVVVVISILNSGLSLGRRLLWVLFVFFMPVLAWFAWYLIGRPDAHRRSPGPA